MYSLLDLANMDVPDLEALPEGEYDLRITSAEAKTFSSGRPGYEIFLKVIGHENAKTVVHRLFLDMDGDDESKIQGFARKVQAFLKAFNITSDEPESWIGKEASAILKLVTDSEYGDKNEIRRFVEPA